MGCNPCIARNKPVVVISKPQKRSDVLGVGGSLPFTHCIQFAFYKIDPSSCHPLTKEIELLHMDETFRSLGIHLLFSQSLKYQPWVFAVFLCGVGKYQDIVNEDDNKIIKIFVENILYQMHEL